MYQIPDGVKGNSKVKYQTLFTNTDYQTQITKNDQQILFTKYQSPDNNY